MINTDPTEVGTLFGILLLVHFNLTGFAQEIDGSAGFIEFLYFTFTSQVL